MMMMKLFGLFLLFVHCRAFSLVPLTQRNGPSIRATDPVLSPIIRREASPRFMVQEKKKTKSGLDENVRNRLLSESIAPWRTVRLFLYFSCGSGALLGGLITLSGTLAAMSGARSDVDLNTEVSLARKCVCWPPWV